MENSKGPSSSRSMIYNEKNSLLPPKSPFHGISPSYTEYVPLSSMIGLKVLPKPGETNSHHQRTSSESVLMEEQPSWLDELLNEPEMPVRRGGHRRSSSDSFIYKDATNVGSMNFTTQDENKLKNLTPFVSWGSQDFDIFSDLRDSSFYMDPIPTGKNKNKSWDAPVSSITPPSWLPILRGSTNVPNSGSSSTLRDADKNPSSYTEKQESAGFGPQDPRGSNEKKDLSQTKYSSSETDTKRAKQQFAQRSRVRKLQYIAELERNVQALESKASEISAELEFLNQQNLILNMENKALKQRLESLAQEQLIKYMEHEVLEREVERLQSVYQQLQATQQPKFSSLHRHANSRDLGQQFANLSLKLKEPSSGCDSASAQLHS